MTPPDLTAPQLRRVLTKSKAYRLSESALDLLALLHERGAVTMTVAAKDLSTSTANLTGIADRLELLGLATRLYAKADADRRKINLEITPRGVLAMEDILAATWQQSAPVAPPATAKPAFAPF